MPSQPFPVSLVFRVTLPTLPHLFLVLSRRSGGDRQQIASGDLRRFWWHRVHIGHLWEYQPLQSHRGGNTGLSGDVLLCKWAAELLWGDQSRGWRPVCGRSCVLVMYAKNRHSKEAVCVSAEVTKEGGFLHADAVHQLRVKVSYF